MEFTNHRRPKKGKKSPRKGQLSPMAPPDGSVPSYDIHAPYFDYYMVLDFEATCQENNENKNFVSEIIEFPFLLLSTREKRVVCEYQRYVRPLHTQPTETPQQPQQHASSPSPYPPVTLTPFCTSLTGITTETVARSEPFSTVWKGVLQFLAETVPVLHQQQQETQGGGPQGPLKICVVTCGDWDLRKMLPSQMDILRQDEEAGRAGAGVQQGSTTHHTYPIPAYFYYWCNIKIFFKNYLSLHDPSLFQRLTAGNARLRVNGMMDLLDICGLPHIGMHHSGIDDVRNISRVMLCLMKRHNVFPFPTYILDYAKYYTDLEQHRTATLSLSSELDQEGGRREAIEKAIQEKKDELGMYIDRDPLYQNLWDWKEVLKRDEHA